MGRWENLWLEFRVYHRNAANYAQNKHAHAILRRISGLEKVARVLWGLTQPRRTQTGRKIAMAGRRPKDAHPQILAPEPD